MANNKFSRVKAIFSLFAAVFLAGFFSGCSKPGDNIVTDGMNALKKKDFDGAISFFSEALDADTNYSDELLYTLLATAYTQKNDFENAIDFHKKALEKRKDYSSYILLGTLCHSLGRDEEAESAYLAAIDFAPKRAEAYGSLGALYLSHGETDKAIEMLEKSVSINHRIGVVQGDLAVAYAMAGDEEKARAALENAEKQKAQGIESFRARVEAALGKGPLLTEIPSAK